MRISIQAATVKQIFSRFLIVIGKNMFVSFLALLLLAVLITALLFYFYVLPLNSVEISQDQIIREGFQEQDLIWLTEKLRNRVAIFQGIEVKKYRNIFALSPIVIENEEGEP